MTTSAVTIPQALPEGSAATKAARTSTRSARLDVLDGWRGISILCVLAAHLLPLGPARLGLNDCAARLGMTIFFTLSGFLITTTLFRHPSTRTFLIRRILRIVPLAWLFILCVLTATRAPLVDLPAHLLFYANLPPFWLTPITGHLWSLCVEMQFYMVVALLFGLFGKRGMFALPLLGVAITVGRIVTGTEISIVTYSRADEILAGAMLALLYEYGRDNIASTRFRFLPVTLLLLTIAACHPALGALAYLRPYLGAALVGSTLVLPRDVLAAPLRMRWLAYVAEISYSLYVIHHFAMFGWFDPPSKLLKYLRRPIGVALTFALAHISTRYYEARWIELGKRWTQKPSQIYQRRVTGQRVPECQ